MRRKPAVNIAAKIASGAAEMGRRKASRARIRENFAAHAASMPQRWGFRFAAPHFAASGPKEDKGARLG